MICEMPLELSLVCLSLKFILTPTPSVIHPQPTIHPLSAPTSYHPPSLFIYTHLLSLQLAHLPGQQSVLPSVSPLGTHPSSHPPQPSSHPAASHLSAHPYQSASICSYAATPPTHPLPVQLYRPTQTLDPTPCSSSHHLSAIHPPTYPIVLEAFKRQAVY